MKLDKRQIRNIIREEMKSFVEDKILRKHDREYPKVPHAESYATVTSFLSRNPDLVWKGVKKIMDITGSTCPKSTAMAVSDYLAKI
jgi:hypothetical protein